jgi:hypothetical protein
MQNAKLKTLDFDVIAGGKNYSGMTKTLPNCAGDKITSSSFCILGFAFFIALFDVVAVGSGFNEDAGACGCR